MQLFKKPRKINSLKLQNSINEIRHKNKKDREGKFFMRKKVWKEQKEKFTNSCVRHFFNSHVIKLIEKSGERRKIDCCQFLNISLANVFACIFRIKVFGAFSIGNNQSISFCMTDSELLWVLCLSLHGSEEKHFESSYWPSAACPSCLHNGMEED